jgi:hypothetical protein
MLSGKQFNRPMRGLTLTYEAVMSLWLASFFDCCGTTERLTDIPYLFLDALLMCHETFTGDMSSWNEDIAVLNYLLEAHLAPLMKDFREWGCAVAPKYKSREKRYMVNAFEFGSFYAPVLFCDQQE